MASSVEKFAELGYWKNAKERAAKQRAELEMMERLAELQIQRLQSEIASASSATLGQEVQQSDEADKPQGLIRGKVSYAVLKLINDEGPLTGSEVAQEMEAQKLPIEGKHYGYAANNAITRLVRQKLIVSTKHGYTITPLGKLALGS